MSRIVVFSLFSGTLLMMFYLLIRKNSIYYMFRIFLYFVVYFSISVISAVYLKDANGCNWLGKLCCVFVSLAIFYIEKITFNEIGLRLPSGIAECIWTIVGVILSIIYSSAETVFFQVRISTSADSLFYQATLPGLDEELFFRGVALAMLLNASPAGTENSRKWIYPASIISLLFFIAHTAPSHVGFYSFSISVPFQILVPTVLLIWIRLRTKSLLGPILAHNATNLAPMIISMS